VAEGGIVELDRVLLVADGDKVTVGMPTVEGAKVVATSQGEGKGKKIIVFKYKSKVRYSRKKGHRQFYTRLTIDKVVGSGAKSDEPKTAQERGGDGEWLIKREAAPPATGAIVNPNDSA
jgi:large subunit ribosomal protein L21